MDTQEIVPKNNTEITVYQLRKGAADGSKHSWSYIADKLGTTQSKVRKMYAAAIETVRTNESFFGAKRKR